MVEPTTLISQNGWPAHKDPNMIGVRNFKVKVKKGEMTIPLAAEAAPQLLQMIEWWDKNIEPVTVIHGYNFREIAGRKGTGKLSNHSSGTGIDINPDRHPLESDAKNGLSDDGKKAVGTVPAHLVPKMLAVAKSLNLRWGGSYPGRKDEMHFDFMGPPPVTMASGPPALSGVHAVANTHYVPKDSIFRKPWFWGIVGVSAVVVTVAGVALLRRR